MCPGTEAGALSSLSNLIAMELLLSIVPMAGCELESLGLHFPPKPPPQDSYLIAVNWATRRYVHKLF